MHRIHATLCRIIAAATAASLAIAATAAVPVRQSFDLQVPAPPTPVTVDGTRRLAYELHLANFSDDALALRRIDVRDAASGKVIATFQGKALQDRLGRPGATAQPGTAPAIAAGMRGVVYLDITLADGIAPKALDHRIEYASNNDSDALHVVEGGPATVGGRSPPVLGAPLRGGPWVAIHAPEWARGHRRMLYAVDGRARIPGRFAIDWVLLDARGRSAHGDGDVARNALGYGAEVLAVADAVVASTRDDVAESATISAQPRHALGDATGNYVALDLGDGRYAFYEHLKPGSLRVATGQRVRRGEVIAALGFTGDSTGPHLHFHVADALSPLGAEGVPFVFERFRVLGAYPDIGALGSAPWTPPGDAQPSWREREWPASNAVVEFEQAPTDRRMRR
jgi:murein DD-endopeptidase